MVFSSGVFLFLFLPIVLAVYYICPGKLRNTVLFVFSLIFYAWGEPIYVGIMIFSTAFDYCNGMLIETFRKKHNEKICKIVMIMSVFVNLGILAFFKYTDFCRQPFRQVYHFIHFKHYLIQQMFILEKLKFSTI